MYNGDMGGRIERHRATDFDTYSKYEDPTTAQRIKKTSNCAHHTNENWKNRPTRLFMYSEVGK